MADLEAFRMLLVVIGIAIVMCGGFIIVNVISEILDILLDIVDGIEYIMEKYFPRFWYYD